jgi:transposase
VSFAAQSGLASGLLRKTSGGVWAVVVLDGVAGGDAMSEIDLFQRALGLVRPWFVARTAFDAGERRLDIHLDFERGARFACVGCGRADCAVHDTREHSWRHLDFFQHSAILHARVPRTLCPDCGVRGVAVPWARPGSGFTLLFEGLVLTMVKDMPVLSLARLVGETDTRIWRIVQHYVEQAVTRMDLSEVRQIAADETSAKRGHDYVSLFVDLARRRVIHVADGKTAETVDEFAQKLEAHGGDREQITDASIDMGASFIAGVERNFPHAEITFDKFHVVKLVNDAVDEVRRAESRENAVLEGTRYLWLKNAENLTPAQQTQMAALEGTNLDTLQAYQMRMNLQDVFQAPSLASARRFLDRWASWVRLSELKPMVRAAATIMEKADGILRSIATKLSNGVIEAINGNVQAAKRKAKGYRSRRNLKAIIYLIAGDLPLAIPT